MEKEEIYWLHRDLDWFATDKDGHIAHFVNGSYGPLPRSLTEQSYQKLYSFFTRLDKISDFILLKQSKGDWSSFIEMAERGLYSYDYEIYDGPYNLISKPVNPMKINIIPYELQEELKNYCLKEICFCDFEKIHLYSFIDCW